MNPLGVYYAHPMRYTLYNPEPIMLSDLPIIPSRISHNLHIILILFPCHHLLFLLCSLNFYCQ